MPDLDVALTIRMLRTRLAGVMVLVSQVEGALVGDPGEALPEDVPDLLWQMQDGLGHAGALVAEWRQATDEGTVILPGDTQEETPEE